MSEAASRVGNRGQKETRSISSHDGRCDAARPPVVTVVGTSAADRYPTTGLIPAPQLAIRFHIRQRHSRSSAMHLAYLDYSRSTLAPSTSPCIAAPRRATYEAARTPWGFSGGRARPTMVPARASWRSRVTFERTRSPHEGARASTPDRRTPDRLCQSRIKSGFGIPYGDAAALAYVVGDRAECERQSAAHNARTDGRVNEGNLRLSADPSERCAGPVWIRGALTATAPQGPATSPPPTPTLGSAPSR